MTRYFDLVPGYESLATVYDSAIEQASEGKGKERHAEDGEPYERQIICEVARRVGLGYPLGQAVKKIYESQRLGGERGVAELLGALNYVAAAVIVAKEELEDEDEEERRDHEFLEGVFAPYAEKKPEFKSGDNVQARLGDGVWRDAVVTEKEITCGKLYYTVKVHDFSGYYILQAGDVRPAPKAEGCEELVQKDLHEDCEGCLYKTYADSHAEEHDAPQTPEETCQRIVDVNPATYKPRKPTGEELAEMAEEECA